MFSAGGHGPDGKLMTVDVKSSETAIETGVPKMLFQTRISPSSFTVDFFDVTADGQKFLLLQNPEQQAADPPITVVVNWLAALKKNPSR